MIQGLKPYPSYKDSGISWVGRVPNHWRVVPLTALARKKSLVNCADRELLSIYLDLGVVRFTDVEAKRTNATSENLTKYQAVDRGDFVLNNQQAWRGSVGVSEYDGIVSPAYLVLKLNHEMRPQFANLLFRDKAMVSQYLVCSKGVGSIQRNLYWPHLKRILVPVPPLKEQRAIVQLLNYYDSKFIRLLAAKKRQIELLKEQKQTIIHEAVARGLEPNVKCKPSGLDWLGHIPSHWQLLRSKYLFREVDDRSTTGSETHLSMSQKHGLVPHTQLDERRFISESYVGAKLVRCNDLVLNRLKAHLGVFAVAKQEGLVSPDYTVFRCYNGVSTRYFELLLRTPTCRTELRRRAKGIVEGFWRLYTDDFYDIRLPVPSFEEQVAIADHIDCKTANINIAIDVTHKAITRIQKYRTRLISELVLGQIDARNVTKGSTKENVTGRLYFSETDDMTMDDSGEIGVED